MEICGRPKAEKSEPSDPQGFNSCEEAGSPLLAKDGPPTPETLPSLPLPGEINCSLYVEAAMIFFEGDTRQANPDVPQGPSTVASRPITRLKARQAPTREIKGVVRKECTTSLKGLMSLLI